MKNSIFFILLFFSTFCFSQIETTNPFDYLNETNEPQLINQEMVVINRVVEMNIIDFITDEYEANKKRNRSIRKIKFDSIGRIISISSTDSLQVFKKEKENLFGRIKIGLGGKKNMINRDCFLLFYNSSSQLDSTWYFSDDYYSDGDGFTIEHTVFSYDENGRVVTQNTKTANFWRKGRGKLDSIYYSFTYQFIYNDEFNKPAITIKCNDKSRVNSRCDTTLGLPRTTYHLGYIPDEIELGENGFVQKITETQRRYANKTKKGDMSKSVSYVKNFIIYNYDSKNRIRYKSYQKEDGEEYFRVNFIYNQDGLLIKKTSVRNKEENILEVYDFIYH